MPGVSFNRCVEVGELQRALLEEVQVPATGREPHGTIRPLRPSVETLSCPLAALLAPSHTIQYYVSYTAWPVFLDCLNPNNHDLVTFLPRETSPDLATSSHVPCYTHCKHLRHETKKGGNVDLATVGGANIQPR